METPSMKAVSVEKLLLERVWRVSWCFKVYCCFDFTHFFLSDPHNSSLPRPPATTQVETTPNGSGDDTDGDATAPMGVGGAGLSTEDTLPVPPVPSSPTEDDSSSASAATDAPPAASAATVTPAPEQLSNRVFVGGISWKVRR